MRTNGTIAVVAFCTLKDGKIYSIQAVFAGRVNPDTQIWPDEK